MFLPIVLDFENNGLKFMLLKYLRFFDLCKKNSWAIITHEEFEYYEINFPNRNEYGQQMRDLYGYSLYSMADRKDIRQYFIKKEFYDNLLDEYGSELERAIHLLNERNYDLENIIDGFIQDLYSHGENIEGILYFAACPVSVKYIAKKYNIKTVSYETGPIRIPNYRCTTSYFCMNGLYDTEEITCRFNEFKKICTEIPVFTREELLTMFLHENNLGYVSLIDKVPKYELGIAGGCALVVPYFAITKYMDHELIDDVLEIYSPQDILVRLHPGDMYKATYRLPYYDATPSPFPFLLISKRIAAVGSNMLFEAMLWKRVACSLAKVMPANIFCNADYTSTVEKDNMEEFVNFFIFSFLVPAELAYDEEYIRWRIDEKPNEKDIYLFHLRHYMKTFGLTEEWLTEEPEVRLRLLKLYRGFSSISHEELYKNMVIADTIAVTKNREESSIKEYVQNVKDEELYKKYIETQEYLNNVLSSTSWKITMPIRKILDLLKAKNK